uniref:Uncharacterized protein n=1 Tax=Arundo donax TaxID=35708 RepID=A0A0A9ECG8_ARUDO
MPVSCCIHCHGIWNRLYRLVAASRTRARLYTPCSNFSKRACIFLRAAAQGWRASSRKEAASPSSFLRSQ